MGIIMNPYRFGGRTLGSAVTGGTNIGDMTANGGLEGAFDGITDQVGTSCAGKTTGTFAYVGKTLAAPTRIYKSISYGSNNTGYVGSINPSTTATLYGKAGVAPANSTDGTSLGSVSFTDTANEASNPREIESSDKETQWDHVWVRISHTGASNTMRVAEVEIFEAV